MSERTRALMARWTADQRVAVAWELSDAYFTNALEEAAARGLRGEAAVAAVRAELRRWRR